MKWEKVEEGYWTLIGSQYFMQKGDLSLDGWTGMDGNGWWVYKDGIRLIGYPNFQEAKGYVNKLAKADAQEDRAYAEAESTREYEWTVEASGLIEATSLEEAKEILLNEADGMVADDRKYWLMKVEKEVV